MSKHRFSGLTFDGVFIAWVRCSNCGIRVSPRVGKQLEGMPCR